MHQSVLDYVGPLVVELGIAERSTLEVGSFSLAPEQGIRQFFRGAYIGVDMQPGGGVDRVAVAQHLPFGDDTFGVVVSTEMLEHDTAPWVSVAEMARVCQPGGYVILTCRGFNETGAYPFHEFPVDSWRYSLVGVDALLGWAGLTVVRLAWDSDPASVGVFALAQKP